MAARTGRGPTPMRALRVPDDVWEAARVEAARRGESLTAAIVRFLIRYGKTKP